MLRPLLKIFFPWIYYRGLLEQANEITQKAWDIARKERYTTIEKFDKTSEEYITKLGDVQDNPAWRFFVFDLKSTILGLMETKSTDEGCKYIGILKGISFLEDKLRERIEGNDGTV